MPDQVITTTTIAPEVIIRQVASPVSNLELILILSGIFATLAIGLATLMLVLLRRAEERLNTGIGDLRTEMREGFAQQRAAHEAVVTTQQQMQRDLHQVQLDLVAIKTRETTLQQVARLLGLPATAEPAAAPSPEPGTAAAPKPPDAAASKSTDASDDDESAPSGEQTPVPASMPDAAAASEPDVRAAEAATTDEAEPRSQAARPQPSSSEPAAPAEPAPPVKPVRHVTPGTVAQPGTING